MSHELLMSASRFYWYLCTADIAASFFIMVVHTYTLATCTLGSTLGLISYLLSAFYAHTFIVKFIP